jgi:putative ABC transport system permease protein
MVAAEVAIALVLLMGAGLMVRSFVRLQAVDPGFEPERALAVQLVLPRARYESAQQANAFYDRLLERVEAQPGVVAAGAVSVLPMSGSNTDVSFLIEGRPEPTSRENSPVADYRSVTSGYLEASGMRLQRGRWVTAADRADAGRVVVVNETMARRYWPNEDAIGRRILFGGSNPTATTVVGVVADVHHNGLDQAVRPEMYLSHLQIAARAMAIVVRTEGDPVSMAGRVRASVREMDTELPIGSQTTLDELVASSVAMPRLIVAFLGFFAFVSVLLAAIGVYGVTAQSVSLRRPEIGIRMALGANARTVVLLIVGQTMLIGAAGLAAGMVGAFALSGALGKLLFELSPKDPATFIVIPLVLAVVVLVASWTPARRAASVDPMKSLRTE